MRAVPPGRREASLPGWPDHTRGAVELLISTPASAQRDTWRTVATRSTTIGPRMPFAIGRKNWLFSQSGRGAHASANLYSLIQTAKANGHEPMRYLMYVLAELPKATDVEDFAALLPHRVPTFKHGS